MKHGTNKKRRCSSRQNSKRKGPIHRVKKVMNAVGHDFVKELYDKTKSPSDNIANMGFDPDPNNFKKRNGFSNNQPVVDIKNPGFLGYAVVPENAEFADLNTKRRILSEVDQKYAVKNIKKHGDDYKKMMMDIKVNYNQLTEKQMEKMCTTYLALPAYDKLAFL